MIFRFREFPVYKDALMFRKIIKEIAGKFPKEEQFALTSQINRAAISVVLNIAEGSDRYSDLDFSRFLNTSLTSLSEVVACLDIARNDSYITEDEYQSQTKKAENIYRQLSTFSAKVRNNKNK